MVASAARPTKAAPIRRRLLQTIDRILIHVPILRIQAQIRTGRRAFALKDWLTAAQHYGAALKLSSERATVWVQYGHALKESGDRPGGEKAYYEALKRRPDFADTYVQLGHVTKLMGRTIEAAAHYRRAAQLDPERQDAVRELEWLESQFGGIFSFAFFSLSPGTNMRNPAAARTAELSITFDVTSLVSFFRSARHPTGI